MIDMLKAIGIEKGKRFAPDAGTRTILEAATREARTLRSLPGIALPGRAGD